MVVTSLYEISKQQYDLSGKLQVKDLIDVLNGLNPEAYVVVNFAASWDDTEWNYINNKNISMVPEKELNDHLELTEQGYDHVLIDLLNHNIQEAKI